MELTLNIYSLERDENGNRIIEKTYKAQSCDLLFAPIEDTLSVLDGTDFSDDKKLTQLIFTMMKQVKPILKDVFYGLTDEELKRTSLNEVVTVIIGILGEALEGILSNENVKNAMRGLNK